MKIRLDNEETVSLKRRESEQMAFKEKAEISLDAQSKLLKVSVVCVIFMMAEVVGGYLSNSIAIMSDAAHLLSDLLSFFVGIYSIRLANKGYTKEYPFGYLKAETIGALLSVMLIWGITAFLLWQAVERLITPPEVFDAKTMLITSIIGVVCNIIMGVTLHQGPGHHHHGHSHGGGCGGHGHAHKERNDSHEFELNEMSVARKGHDHDHSNEHSHDHDHEEESSDEEHSHEGHSHEGHSHGGHSHGGHGHGHGHDEDSEENMNVRAAFIHIISDLIQSVVVVIIAAILYYNPEWKAIDPILTFTFSFLVLYTTIPLSRQCMRMLMIMAPEGFDLVALRNEFEEVMGVVYIYDFKIWQVNRNKNVISAKVVVEKMDMEILKSLQKLSKKYKVVHSTFQLETDEGSDEENNLANGFHDDHGHSHHDHGHHSHDHHDHDHHDHEGHDHNDHHEGHDHHGHDHDHHDHDHKHDH